MRAFKRPASALQVPSSNANSKRSSNDAATLDFCGAVAALLVPFPVVSREGRTVDICFHVRSLCSEVVGGVGLAQFLKPLHHCLASGMLCIVGADVG